MSGRPRALVGAIAGCAALGVAVVGCAETPPATLPDGIRVEVQQGRTDYTSGTLVIRVVNESTSDVDLEHARLNWQGFAGSAEWDRGTTVRQGTTVDLRTPVPEVMCESGTVQSTPTADLTFRAGDRSASVTVAVTDPLSTLDRLYGAGCIRESVDRVATISLGSPVIEGEGRTAVAVLPLTITPTGAGGRMTVSAVSSTPLLIPDPQTHPDADDWPIVASIDAASGDVTTRLRIVPARCDAHAIADDKVGTVLNLGVTLPDGLSGDYQLIPPSEIRVALLEYVRATCGLL